MTYEQQLKQPEWFAKRKEVIALANNTCEQCCGDSADDKLEVHHGVYLKGKLAWQYPNDVLYCLCPTCHWNIQEDMDEIYLTLGNRGLELDRLKVMVRRNFETREQKQVSSEYSQFIENISEKFPRG